MIITNIGGGGGSLDPTTATADKILNGYTAYNGDKEKLTGTALSTATTFSASDLASGKTAYNSSGSLITGTYDKPERVTVELHASPQMTISEETVVGSGNITFTNSHTTFTLERYTSAYFRYTPNGGWDYYANQVNFNIEEISTSYSTRLTCYDNNTGTYYILLRLQKAANTTNILNYQIVARTSNSSQYPFTVNQYRFYVSFLGGTL